MYILKEQFEDFYVEEIPLDDMLCDEATNFHVYLLEKQNYTSERAVQQIARSLGIPRKRVTYAGTKDKQAITKQYITIHGASKERIAKLSLKDISLSFVGYSKQHLGLGVLKGNLFKIIVRNLDADDSFPKFPETFVVPNYFDEQRFSTNNVAVGLHILQRKFDLAAAQILKHDEDYRTLLQDHLEKHDKDFVGALRKLPRRSLLFYVHSVQSYFFNELLREQLEKTGSGFETVEYSKGNFAFPKTILSKTLVEELPLPGYLSKDALSIDVLKRHELTRDAFLIRQIPELSLEGQNRLAYMQVENFKIGSLENGELHEGKKKIEVSFSLPKGAYATILIRQVIAATQANRQ